MDTLIEIWQSLRRNKFRTAMTGFAVSWGIFILVVLLGASSGLQHGFEKNYAGQMSNALTVSGGWAQKPYKGLPIWRQILITPEAYKVLEQQPEVAFITPVGETGGAVRYRDEETTLNVKGVTTDYHRIKKTEILRGRALLPMDVEQELKVVVLNERALRDICNGDLGIVGNYIQIGSIFYRVVGVAKDKDAWGGGEALIPYSIFRKIYQSDGKIRRVEAVLQPGTKGFPDKVRHMLSPMLRYDETDERALWIRDYEEDYADMMKVMWALRLFILIVSICTLISGAVGVSNIMLVSVRERTKELGIRKALGAPPVAVLQSVVGESLVITALFGLVGVLLGTGVVKIINLMTAGAKDTPFINPTVDMGTVLIATLILIVVGVVAGAVPATKAMKVKPIEAMRDN